MKGHLRLAVLDYGGARRGVFDFATPLEIQFREPSGETRYGLESFRRNGKIIDLTLRNSSSVPRTDATQREDFKTTRACTQMGSRSGGRSECAPGFLCKEPRDDRAGDISEGDDLGYITELTCAWWDPRTTNRGGPHGGRLLREEIYI